MRGGKRPGAGRRKGDAKGPKRKATEKIIASAEARGDIPLEFFLSLMRDLTLPLNVRFEAAKAAAPYMHAKKQETTVQGGFTINVTPFDMGIG